VATQQRQCCTDVPEFSSYQAGMNSQCMLTQYNPHSPLTLNVSLVTLPITNPGAPACPSIVQLAGGLGALVYCSEEQHGHGS
jgi:hypothetical protein